MLTGRFGKKLHTMVAKGTKSQNRNDSLCVPLCPPCENLKATNDLLGKGRGHVPENQCVIVLTCLVGKEGRITTTGWIELVLASVGDSGR